MWLLGGCGKINTLNRHLVVYLFSAQPQAVHTQVWAAFTERRHRAIFSVNPTGHGLSSTKQQMSQVTSWVSTTDLHKPKGAKYNIQIIRLIRQEKQIFFYVQN